MNEIEFKETFDLMMKMFGDKVPDPDHNPNTFKFLFMLASYERFLLNHGVRPN